MLVAEADVTDLLMVLIRQGATLYNFQGGGESMVQPSGGVSKKVFTDSSFCSPFSLQREKVGRGGA